MYRIILFCSLFFIIPLQNKVNAQIVWEERFSTPDKGYWMGDDGSLASDLAGVDWTLDVTNALFAASGDYAKTVATSGGRFEVIDSDGDVIWYSPQLNISGYSAVTLSVKTSETGSSTSAEKKYIKARYLLDNAIYTFSPDSASTGNWGEKTLSAQGIKGNTLQVIMVMNSSYSNDKVIIDDVIVEGVDSTLYEPHIMTLAALPSVAFAGEETSVSASVWNKKGEMITDQEFDLRLVGSQFSVNEKHFNQGIYTWDVTPATTGKQGFSIHFEDNSVSSIDTVLQVYSRENLIVFNDFESGDLSGWQSDGDWEMSTESPITGTTSLKHIVQAEGGTSTIENSSQKRNLGDGNYQFSFKLKNGNWDPSSSNAFYVKLTDGAELPNGYAVGVNATGSTDKVSLWTVDAGKVSDLVTETSFDWGEGNIVQIDLSRSNTADWQLTATDMNTGMAYPATATNNAHSTMGTVGLNFVFSQTRSGQLWFDDLMILRVNTPPGINKVESLSEGTIRICFTEPVNTQMLTASSFEIKNTDGESYAVTAFEVVSSDTILLLAEGIDDANLLLTVRSVEDSEGLVGDIVDFPFDVVSSVAETDVAITEIMADPTPVVNLPEAEYLEILNRSNARIDLKGLKLLVKDQTYSLPEYLLEPGEYYILCAATDSSLFAQYGHVLPLAKFPSLLNAGTKVALIASDGRTIDELTYSDDWYHDSSKKNGGWSLEKIDLARFCGNSSNWSASNDTNGGTPGKVNSINGSNVDGIAPEITGWELVSASCFQVRFSETLDAASAEGETNFTVDGDLEIDSIRYDAKENTLVLWFAEPVAENTLYQLTLSGISDECGNTMPAENISIIRRVIRPLDIVINEVLFNPHTGGSDFVELYNRSALPVDLKSLRLATRNDTLGLKSVYQLTKENLEFPARSYVVLTKDSADLVTSYWVPIPECIVTMSSFPAYNDDAGKVVLLNDSMEVIDEFAYNESMHNSWISDPEGVSLERLSTEDATNNPGNWHSASSLVGYATPGYENSQAESEEPVSAAMLVSPDAISPNNDGYNDQLEIRLNLDKTGYMANMFVYDVSGRRVNRLLNNSLVGTHEKIVFNGIYENGTQLPLGIYILLAELIHADGSQKVFKQTFLVTDRQCLKK